MDRLPEDVLLAVFSALSARDLARCGGVCAGFGALAKTDSLWKTLCAADFGASATAARAAPSCRDRYVTRLQTQRRFDRKEFSEITLFGHTDSVCALTAQNHSDALVSGSVDGSLRSTHRNRYLKLKRARARRCR